eukprot:TRINITY_DN18771_c0_g1_i2.p3 TRINITY_DN18771_c0_g1~~TRINITY_DN18771_c0_g1_i2.p3  ORF type:complete len:194 (+),score=22.54 TRINITY_DN18771_c0_g1_i2:1257-1838(+)
MSPCMTETDGSCRVFGCSAKRGAADCVHGKCVCTGGHCQVNGKCVSNVCETHTPGTCSLFGCSAKRGVTNCVSGKCVCASGACSVDGKCVDVCPRATGGSCSVFGCASSRGPTECSQGQCVCRPGACSLGGRCVQAATTVLWMASKDVQPAQLSTAAAAAFAAGSACVLAALIALQLKRKMHLPDADEPLLAA